MSDPEIPQPPAPEIPSAELDNLETEQEQQKQNIARSIADDRRSADSAIEAKALTVQRILNELERQPIDRSETSGVEAVENPEEVMDKIKVDILQLEHSTIDDIFKVLLTSRLASRGIKSWLATNSGEIQSLTSRRRDLVSEDSQLTRQLEEEEWKNFFVKLFRGKKRRAVSARLEEISTDITQIDTTLKKRKSRGWQIETNLKKFSARQQEFALNAVEQLFESVLEGYARLKERLTSSAVKQELNEDLIARRVLPELDRLQVEGKITREDAEEFVELLKTQLAEGSQSNWNDSDEKKEAINARIKRLNKLDEKSQFRLEDVRHRVSFVNDSVMDNCYDTIFDFLLREMAKGQVEQLCDSLCGSLDVELQAKVDKIAERVIYPSSSWRLSGEKGEVLDLNRLPINEFKRLNGLERWRVVKNFTESSGMISRDVFARVEKIIIQRLFNEQLFPGGHESWDGTEAAEKMGALGNPEALPLMLRHIEAYIPGHTSNAVVHDMERLLKESDPAELQQVLESLPRNKRILLETLADENSYMSRFGRINSRYHTCHLLQNGALTVAREQLTKILEQGGELDDEKLRGFYLGYTEHMSEALDHLLKARTEVERVIIDSKLGIWAKSVDKLLAALVNPRHGESVAFPKRIAQEGLGVSDEKMLTVLEKIFETKTFKGSGFEREAFLDGMILLNSKENGKAVLETLLGAYRGSRDDPSRMRRVFQLLSTLDDFGEYGFVTPSQAEIESVEQEISTLENQLKQTPDKTERKKIKNRVETLNRGLQNMTGLKGIEDLMIQKVVDAACRRLELPQEYRDKIENNLEELIKSGVFEIVPSLAGKYEWKNEAEVKNLLKTITAHIIDGDFKSWRYSHERSGEQLAGLTEEQKKFWEEILKPITIDIELPEDEKNKRAHELKAAQEIIRNAKEHILITKPDFDFSKERATALAAQVGELTERIKSTVSEDEKKQLVLEKRVVQAEATLINGILEIENATPKSFTRNRMFTQARELRERITELNLPLAGLDIEQIEKVFTVGDVKNVTAYESDDALTLLRVGVEPQETCQSWRNGGFNECLLAYVADSNKKVLNVADDKGKIVARSIIKLTNQRDKNDVESKTQRKTLFVERPYSLLPNSEVYRAFIRVLLTKAHGLDASITFGKGFDADTLRVFEEEARAIGYEMKERGLDIFIPNSMNKYEYSDTLGGKISWFDRYQQLEAVTFEKLKI